MVEVLHLQQVVKAHKDQEQVVEEVDEQEDLVVQVVEVGMLNVIFDVLKE